MWATKRSALTPAWNSKLTDIQSPFHALKSLQKRCGSDCSHSPFDIRGVDANTCSHQGLTDGLDNNAVSIIWSRRKDGGTPPRRLVNACLFFCLSECVGEFAVRVLITNLWLWLWDVNWTAKWNKYHSSKTRKWCVEVKGLQITDTAEVETLTRVKGKPQIYSFSTKMSFCCHLSANWVLKIIFPVHPTLQQETMFANWTGRFLFGRIGLIWQGTWVWMIPAGLKCDQKPL